MNKIKYTCAIVDDEEKSIQSTMSIIENLFPEVQVVASFQNPIDALREIPELDLDFVLIDVSMPVMGGLELVKALPEENRPEVVFLTGYDQYAIEAIRLSALDYIIKPLNPLKLKEFISRFDLKKNKKLVDTKHISVLLVNRVDKAIVLNAQYIDYLSASGPYTNIVMSAGDTHVATKTLKLFFRTLEPHGFVRPHRSYVFNPRNIVEIKKESDGSGIVLFASGNSVNVTVDCKNALINALSQL